MKASPEELREALRGRVTKHHRFLLRLHLNQIDALAAAMATIDAQLEESLEPFRTAVELITSIPGIESLSAHVIVSEIGIDMSRFPSATHLICRVGEDVAILTPHRSGCADFQLPVPHGRASLTAV